MSAFTTGELVRIKLQLEDEHLLGAALLDQSIADAHAEVAAMLEPGVDTDTPAQLLVQGETLLAGAHCLRSLAASDAARMRHVQVNGQRIAPSQRYAALRALAADFEADAWRTLAPFLAPTPASVPLSASPSHGVWTKSSEGDDT